MDGSPAASKPTTLPPPSAPPAAAISSPAHNELVDLVLLLLRHGRLVFGLPLLLGVLIAGWSLIAARDYTATAAFAPSSATSSLSRFAGVAAQLGVALPTQQANESADFYADLLRSRHVLSQLVHTRYTVPGSADSVGRALIDWYGITKGDSAIREDRAVRRLGRDLEVSVSSKTGVVNFAVTTKFPALSERIAERALDVVNQFNLQRRQSRAGAERRFVEARLADAQTDLRAYEDRLQLWLQQNRDYRNSPRLQLAFERLQNEVTLRRGVVTTLAQAFEQARVEEVRDTPVLTVVEDPVIPSKPDSRRIVAKLVLTLMLGFGVGAVLAISSESWRRLDLERPGDVAEAQRLLRGLWPLASDVRLRGRSTMHGDT